MSNQRRDQSKTHVVQTVDGRVLTGNAGLTKTHIKKGYVLMLCTEDSKGRFVDLVLTKEQINDLKTVLEAWADDAHYVHLHEEP